MTDQHQGTITLLAAAILGEARAGATLAALDLPPALAAERGDTGSRAAIAMALAACLFADLLDRVPSGAAYVADRVAAGGRVRFDHGAIRTVRFAAGGTGALPPGEEAFRRILEPLGYRMAGVYPLPALSMTGRAYCHRDLPEAIPQYFVSELHVNAFDAPFAAAAARVFGGSRDPLGAGARRLLDALAADGAAPIVVARAGLPELVAAFGRQHDLPTLADHAALGARSAEAAWIATEGNGFNHATDRVADIEAVAAAQKALGRAMKDRIEVSASGRVRQTAFRADPVIRRFADGAEREVPGSFYEFIARAIDPATGGLDLGFDSGNATGIFAMTRVA